MFKFITKQRRELLFTAIVLVLAGLMFLLTHPKTTDAVAVLTYGDPQQQLRIPLNKPAYYDIQSNGYTIHLRVTNGGISFVDSPCPDHLCEGFGFLYVDGDWAACVPAKASLIVEDG